MRRDIFFALNLVQVVCQIFFTSGKLTYINMLKKYLIEIEIECCLKYLIYLETLKNVGNFVLIIFKTQRI